MNDNLLTDTGDESRGFIKSAIKEWQTKTCVKFIDRTSEEDYIEFVYEEGYVRLAKFEIGKRYKTCSWQLTSQHIHHQSCKSVCTEN